MDFISNTNALEKRKKGDAIYGNISDIAALGRKEECRLQDLKEFLCSCGRTYLAKNANTKYCHICKQNKIREDRRKLYEKQSADKKRVKEQLLEQNRAKTNG